MSDDIFVGGIDGDELKRLKRELADETTKVILFSDEAQLPDVEGVVRIVKELYDLGFSIVPGPHGMPSAAYYAMSVLHVRPEPGNERCFVTRNTEFLARAVELEARYGVKPISPEQAQAQHG